MMQNRRSIAAAAAVLAIAAVLAGCTAAVEPAVSFAAEKLTISLPRMVVGQAVPETTLPEAMGGEQELVYSLVPDIPGLTFDPATRVLSGTPTMPGTYNMTYTAKDAATGGTMESVKFVITVDARPLTLEERIRGTWQYTEPWYEDDQFLGTWVDFVTFTKSRFIFVRSHFDAAGNFVYEWRENGEWEITDQEIARISYHDHDDDEDTPEELTTLHKSYVLVGGDVLLVHDWAASEASEPTTPYDRMNRVSGQHLSLPPLGVWVREYYDDDHFEIRTMTLEADGTFIWTDEYPEGTWTLTAEWQLDADDYFINLTNAAESWTGTGEEPESADNTHGASYLRFAYAPAPAEPGERMIVVSFWENEIERPQQGDYWITMREQQ